MAFAVHVCVCLFLSLSVSRSAQALPICVGAAKVRLTVPKCHQKIIGLRGEIKTKDRRRAAFAVFYFILFFRFFFSSPKYTQARERERLTDDDNRVLRVLQRLRRGD